MRRGFDRFARRAAAATGSPWAFALALAVVLIWAVAGPFLGFSQVWQLAINTGTTISTFLMVFLIQSATNRQSAEILATIREMAEDLPDVRDERIATRIEEEEEG